MRRRGVARWLLDAAERHAAEVWRERCLALHVHEDNGAAVRLYHSVGMAEALRDPEWRSWLGSRRRVVLYKELV